MTDFNVADEARQSLVPDEPLFRREVLAGRQSQWLGPVLLEPRISAPALRVDGGDRDRDHPASSRRRKLYPESPDHRLADAGSRHDQSIRAPAGRCRSDQGERGTVGEPGRAAARALGRDPQRSRHGERSRGRQSPAGPPRQSQYGSADAAAASCATAHRAASDRLAAIGEYPATRHARAGSSAEAGAIGRSDLRRG